MEIVIKVIGLAIKNKEKEFTLEVIMFIREILKTIKKMVLECLKKAMEKYTKDSGKMILDKEKENLRKMD